MVNKKTTHRNLLSLKKMFKDARFSEEDFKEVRNVLDAFVVLRKRLPKSKHKFNMRVLVSAGRRRYD